MSDTIVVILEDLIELEHNSESTRIHSVIIQNCSEATDGAITFIEKTEQEPPQATEGYRIRYRVETYFVKPNGEGLLIMSYRGS